MKTLDVLTKARSILTEEGWTTACFKDDAIGDGPGKGCFCLMGALNEAANPGYCNTIPKSRAGRSAYNYVRGALGLGADSTDYAIGSWNDRPGRTLNEVIAVLGDAIRNAKRRHINGRRYATTPSVQVDE